MLAKNHTNNWKKQQFRLCIFFLAHLSFIKTNPELQRKKIRLSYFTDANKKKIFCKLYHFPLIPTSFLLMFSILSRKQVLALSQQYKHKKKVRNRFKLTKTTKRRQCYLYILLYRYIFVTFEHFSQISK